MSGGREGERERGREGEKDRPTEGRLPCSATHHSSHTLHTTVIPSFITGLFGGFAYIQTYTYMSDNIPENRKEMAIAATTIGENLGSSVASLVAIAVQAALWSRLGIN